MTRFIPLKSNNTDNPVLHIDSQAPLDLLFASADRRIRMARHLLECLEGADECDVRYMANAALMLLSDGYDALDTVEKQIICRSELARDGVGPETLLVTDTP